MKRHPARPASRIWARSRFLYAMGAVAVLLVGLETLLRLSPRLMPVQWQIRHGEIEGGRVFRVVPDAELGFVLPAGDGTDSRGFPNAEPWPEHPAFAFLGDSLLGGDASGPAASFPHIIGAVANEPVLNLGMPGAGLERQYLIYRRYGSRLRPRLVVACLYLASDFDNDLTFLGWRRKGQGTDYDSYRNSFGRRQQGTPDYVAPMTLLRTLQFGRLAEKFRLYIRVSDLYRRAIGAADTPELYRFPDGVEAQLDVRKLRFAGAPAETADPRIEALLAALHKLQALTDEQRSHLVVMLIPSKEELAGVAPSAAGVNVVARTRQRLRDERVPVLDLYPALKDAGAVQAPFFAEDIHLNAFGRHIVAAEFLAWFNAHRADLE